MDLVSVVIVTYNSENTIEDALNSIYNQTYKNIELIVADDCSPDRTLEVVKKWSDKGNVRERFNTIKVYSNKHNVGTSRNVNGGCKVSSGKWIKTMAGDDVLMEDCIEANMEFLKRRGEDVLVVSDTIDFWQKDGTMNYRPHRASENLSYLRKLNKKDSKKQYKQLMKKYAIDSPTFFFSKKLWKEIGEYDLRYGLMEDWPFVVRCTKQGRCLRYLEQPTVYYRVGDPYTSKTDNFYNVAHLKRIEKFKKEEIYPNISKMNIGYYISEIMTKLQQWLIICVFKNKVTKFTTYLNYVLSWLIPRNWGTNVIRLWKYKFGGLLKEQKWNLERYEKHNEKEI